MAANETAGAAADETTSSHQVICLDIREGHKGYVAPTPELIAESRNAPVFADDAVGTKLDACACRGKASCGLVASGAIDMATGCISITSNPEMQRRMLGMLPADVDQPKHVWLEADVPVSIWSLAMQNKPQRTDFKQFGHLFSKKLVIARRGSLTSHSCDALDRFADATVLEAAADQRRLKIFVLGTHAGDASCLAHVNGVTEGAVIDAALVNYKGTPLTKEGGLALMLRNIMTEGGGDFLSSNIMGSVVQALVNAAAFGAALRAVADGASPLGHAYGAVLTSSPLRCGPQDRWLEHLVEWLVNVQVELAIIQQGVRPPKLDHGLSAAARCVARAAYAGGLRLKAFGLKKESYSLSDVGKLLARGIDKSITARRAVKFALATEARSLATQQAQLLVRQALDAVAAGFTSGLAAVAEAGLRPALIQGNGHGSLAWTKPLVSKAVAKLKASLAVPPLKIQRATALVFPALSAKQIEWLRAGDFPENGSGCCVVCGLSGGGAMVPCGCGALAHLACVNGAALSETNCPVCKDVEARAKERAREKAAVKKRKERFAAPARESSRPRRGS